MKIKKGVPINALVLAQKLKNSKNEEENLSKFEEFFALPFKITVSMKKILQEILKIKEYSYKYNCFKRKISLLERAINFDDTVSETEVDEFKLLNIKSVTLGYDKYTVFSKKEFFYIIEFEHVATITQYLKESKLSLVDDSYYEAIVKLSKNINEYYETEVTLSGDRKEKLEKIIVKKEIFDSLDKKSYFENNNTFIMVEDVLKNYSKESEVVKVHYYESSF